MRKTRLSKAKLINQIKLMYHSLPIKNFENLDNLLTHKYLSDKPYSWSYAFYKSLRKGDSKQFRGEGVLLKLDVMLSILGR